MKPARLFEEIQRKKSYLCIGLDADIKRIPAHLHLRENPIRDFNQAIIEATSDLAVAYKPNTAFYEAMGPKGWKALKATRKAIPKECLAIADAKRGDIGNTSRMYAEAFFEQLKFDAVTVAPYMGSDSVLPFLQYKKKWVFLLALTSNGGAEDFQWHGDKSPLHEKVVQTSLEWGKMSKGNLGYVIGATRPEYLSRLRKLAPESFFLVPGVGAQGGDLNAVLQHGTNEQGGLLVNSSRGIIYAGDGKDFAYKAREAALALQTKMAAQFKPEISGVH